MTTSLLILARAFHLGSGMILFGVVAFRWLILLPAFAGEADETWQQFAPLFLRLNRIFIWSGALLVTSGLALFWAVSAGMSDTSLIESLNGETLATVFLQTQFGYVLQWRLGLAVIMAILMWCMARGKWQLRRTRSALEIVAGLVATALMISFAWTGHAAASSGPDWGWRILADATHLFATSIWPTGLLPFALFLGCAQRINAFAHLRPVVAAVNRFSTVSFITVGVLIATGILNTCFIVGSFSAMITTDYGRLLCLKLFLLLVILRIAAWNRYRLVPLILGQTTAPDKNLVTALLRRLQGFVATELGLAAAIIMIVSLLGITPPPH